MLIAVACAAAAALAGFALASQIAGVVGLAAAAATVYLLGRARKALGDVALACKRAGPMDAALCGEANAPDDFSMIGKTIDDLAKERDEYARAIAQTTKVCREICDGNSRPAFSN